MGSSRSIVPTRRIVLRLTVLAFPVGVPRLHPLARGSTAVCTRDTKQPRFARRDRTVYYAHAIALNKARKSRHHALLLALSACHLTRPRRKIPLLAGWALPVRSGGPDRNGFFTIATMTPEQLATAARACPSLTHHRSVRLSASLARQFNFLLASGGGSSNGHCTIRTGLCTSYRWGSPAARAYGYSVPHVNLFAPL